MALVQEVSEGIAGRPHRTLPAIQTGSKALINHTPTTRDEAMGLVGMRNIISLVTDGHATNADATLTLYIWQDDTSIADVGGFWSKGGANVNDYTKTFEEKGFGAFRAPFGARFYIKSSIDIDYCRLDCSIASKSVYEAYE